MKVVLLAGGYGTRMSEYTELLPKPMVKIGKYPILWHIMNFYASYGHKDFLIALGYKAEVIKEFFYKFHALNSDFSVNLGSGEIEFFNQTKVDWKVSLMDTGMETMTGGRLLRMRDLIDFNEPFLLTYGDGVSNIDIEALVAFHHSHGKLITMSAVRPSARFGELDIIDGRVVKFEEKPQLYEGWINGGYFVVEPGFLKLIDGDEDMLERRPLERAAKLGELMAFKHEGFWQCMDTKREHQLLESMWHKGDAPWIR